MTSMEALSNVTDASQNSLWYRGGHSSSEPTSQPQVNRKLDRDLLGLDKEELSLMCKTWTCDAFALFIDEVGEEVKRSDRGEKHEKSKSLLHTFSHLANHLGGIVRMMPSNPEYSAALGAIAVLIRSFRAKAEMESKILDHLNQIRDVLPTVDFLASTVRNSQMTIAVSGICSEIVHYLYEAIAYSKKPRLGKFVGSLVSTFETKFGKHVSAIQSHTTTIRNLQNTANLAVSLDTMNKLEQSANMLFDIFKEFRASIASMAERLEETNLTISRQFQFTANLQTRNLLELLLPEICNVDRIINFVDGQQKRLPPTERWENRGFENDVRNWFQRKPRPLLYISGEPKKNRISFLSPFMVDLAGVLSLEQDVGFSYAFCDTTSIDSNTPRLTPDLVYRQLTGQLLSSYPHLAIDYVNELPLSRFRTIGTSTSLAFELFRDVLLKARDQQSWPQRGFFILIDRIDMVQDTKDCNVSKDLLPKLQQLGSRFEDVNVVVTSSIASISVLTLDPDDILLHPIVVSQPKKIVPHRYGINF